MSNKSHRKYWVVTTTHIVSANNKSEAMLATQNKRGIEADILSADIAATQVRASEAKEMASSE